MAAISGSQRQIYRAAMQLFAERGVTQLNVTGLAQAAALGGSLRTEADALSGCRRSFRLDHRPQRGRDGELVAEKAAATASLSQPSNRRGRGGLAQYRELRMGSKAQYRRKELAAGSSAKATSLPGSYPAALMASTTSSRASSLLLWFGAKPPSSPTAVASLCTVSQRLGKAGAANCKSALRNNFKLWPARRAFRLAAKDASDRACFV